MENQLKTIDQNPIALINMALEKGLDVEKLSKLFDLQERWEKKEAEKSFLMAFANFQRTCPEIKKSKKVSFPSKTGGNVNYSYAPLPEIVKQIKGPLADNQLSYRWEFIEAANMITCICIVSHADGCSKESRMSGPKDDSGNKNIIQQSGSTHTYLQRYTLIGALGLSSADADIDGRSTTTPNQTKHEVIKPVIIPQKTPAEINILLAKYKKELEEEKTLTELNINAPNIIKRAIADGCPAEVVRGYANAIHAAKQKAQIKNDNANNTQQNLLNLP